MNTGSINTEKKIERDEKPCSNKFKTLYKMCNSFKTTQKQIEKSDKFTFLEKYMISEKVTNITNKKS